MKVLQIEFNELSPQLLDEFMAAGELPNFRRLYESSQVFTTDADAAPPRLEPWVQWPTVHLGVSHREHGLRHLGATRSDDDLAQGRPPRPPVAQVASDAGLRVGVFGAMNVPYGDLNGFYVPDPWNSKATAKPATLGPYLRTIGTMVRDSSRVEGVAPGAGLVPFAAFMLRHGLTPATVSVLVRQLAAERRDPGVRWRRASALDWIQYDVFRTLARRERVDFATFFSNSTAHYQHYFWRHMNPESFDTPPEPSDHPSYAGAILFGYRSMDRILGRMLADHPEATLVLCTALSQQPWTDATKQTYRPKSWEAALQLAGYTTRDVDVRSIMAEQFVARFASEEAAVTARERFGELELDGQRLMRFTRDGAALIGGCAIDHGGALTSRIRGTADGSEPLMGDVFTPIHTVRSGRHSSEGALWIGTGRHAVHDQPVALEDVAPTVLDLLGVAAPPQMTGRRLQLDGVRADRGGR
ncbi:hypothetical protein [Modestobacter sp. URMC 112]